MLLIFINTYEERNGHEKVIFGGRGNLKRRFLNKITNEQWKELRLENICSIGESPQKGNRKFDLQIIEENKIIFKPSKKLKIYLDDTGNHTLKNWKRIIELNTGIIKE